jgi:hypothetical protein
MDFSAALAALKDGKNVRRQAWAGTMRGLYLMLAPELVETFKGDEATIMPQLLVMSQDGVLRPFSGANWDLLAEDWEIVQ